jgi:hypothetical protein
MGIGSVRGSTCNAGHTKGTLEADRVRRLQDLPGWAWDPSASRWEDGFGRLLKYVDQHGHARVPHSYTDGGSKLGEWVTRQRVNQAKGALDTDRQRRLEDLPGWTWDPRTSRWEEGFGRLLHYVDQHGHARVPQSYTIEGYKLGSWVTTQRYFHNKNALDVDRQRRLQRLPGWTWKASSST